jgi:hypothetical protein
MIVTVLRSMTVSNEWLRAVLRSASVVLLAWSVQARSNISCFRSVSWRCSPEDSEIIDYRAQLTAVAGRADLLNRINLICPTRLGKNVAVRRPTQVGLGDPAVDS